MKLWYEQPAASWTEALPIGNGRLGAMVFGKTSHELIPLNCDTLWSGYPSNLNPKDKSGEFLQAMELAKNGKYHEAQELIESDLTSGWGQSYMPMGDLILVFNHEGEAGKYKRELDLETAVASVEYEMGGALFKREVFASATDQLIVVKICAEKPASIHFKLGFASQLKSSVSVKNNRVILKGEAPSYVEPSYVENNINPVIYSEKDEERGMLFATMARVVMNEGQIIHHSDGLQVKDASEVLILISARTSFAGFDVHPYLYGRKYEEPCFQDLESAACKSYEELKSRHIADYRKYYDRVQLGLGDSSLSGLPTDKRLYGFNQEQNDPSLYTLLFQYGRYLLIASSREGTQAANLQGIWNSELRPPWSSNYTININTQMNYWPVFSCGLAELHEPLVRLIKELSITGRATASEVYGADGFTAHHNADIWRLSSPVGSHRKGSAGFAFWNMSAGWLCRHLFEQYEYTLDTVFLENVAYPIMKSAAEFLLGIMTEDRDAHLIICPSTSPENTFIYEGKRCHVSATTTMTMTIAKELFKNCIKCCEILKLHPDFADKLRETLERLYPYKTGSKGQLLEWYEEYEEAEPGHRHISHLYGLHPSNEITVEETPALALACKTSLDLRGDEGTGWSLGWKINQWARLFDGNRALKLLNRQLRVVNSTGFDYSSGGGTYINMLDAHPPFQIDGNFGATSGIAEMLLQSRDNKLFVLPALPDGWIEGRVSGLCAKGMITVNIQWSKESITAEILSKYDKSVLVGIRGTDMIPVELKAGVMKTIKNKQSAEADTL